MSIIDIPEPDALEGAPHPRLTRQLLGQQAAEQGFLAAFNGGRLHHGWLITGPRGIGKATLAWKIARFLLSQPTQGGGLLDEEAVKTAIKTDSLETDFDAPISRRITALSEPRLFLCRRPWDAKSERLKQDITVDEVRRLKSFFNLSASDGGHRVVIVDAADEMNVNAANALLKILEEPPAQTTLLLISHRPMRLLPTIRSRCRVLKCSPLPEDAMAQALSNAGFEAEQNARDLSLLANGSVGEAIRLLSEGGVTLYRDLLALFGQKTRMNRLAATKLAESCTGKGNVARYDLVLRLCATFMHRLALTGIGLSTDFTTSSDEAKILNGLAPSAQVSRKWANLAAELQDRSQHARAVNLDPASVILDMLLKIDQLCASVGSK